MQLAHLKEAEGAIDEEAAQEIAALRCVSAFATAHGIPAAIHCAADPEPNTAQMDRLAMACFCSKCHRPDACLDAGSACNAHRSCFDFQPLHWKSASAVF